MPRPRRRSLDSMEKDARAADLYRRGLTYRQIAKEMGWRSPAAAFQSVRRAVADTTQDPLAQAEALALMLERIQDRRRRLWQVATTKHVVVDQGKVITDPVTHQPLLDDGPVLRALVALRQDDELEGRLRDLFPATKKVVEVITEDVVDANIRAIRDRLIQLGALPPELAGGGRLAIPAYSGAGGEDRAVAHVAGGRTGG